MKTRSEADERARELMSEARQVSSDVRAGGTQLADHVRQLGDSLRSNAERLLRDVQAVHSAYLGEIDKVDPSRARLNALESSAGGRGGRARDGGSSDDLDVPEFIPRGPNRT